MTTTGTNLPRRLGRYEIVGKLAMGGMAEILLGRLTGPSGFERPVVVKRILPHLLGLSEFVDMFLDEGRIAGRIGHPNVVQVQELGREDDELYLVMEYLEGESTAALARRARARRETLSPALCAHIVAGACAGLHAAHELRSVDGAPLDIVHRDVSPQNIFVGYDGTVKVLDFGIAKAAGRITQTEAGVLKGKFEYMSPEQARGEPLDRRSDVFALGIVLYELSAQRRLFRRGSQTETLRAVTEEPIPPPSALVPDYPPALERICLRALRRDRDERYATAQDMRRDLLEALRALDGPALPEEAIATRMRDLFAERIEEKGELLARMRDGLDVEHVPAADVPEAELPTVEAGLPRTIDASPEPPGRRSANRWVFAATAVALAMGAAAYVGLGGGETASEPVRASTPAAAAPAARDDRVDVVVESEPAGARLTLDGEARGATPLTLTLPASEEPRTLRLERDGFAPIEETFHPDVDQRLRLTLPPAAAPEPAVEPSTAERRGRSARRPHRAQPQRGADTPAPPPPTPAEPRGERQRAFRRFK